MEIKDASLFMLPYKINVYDLCNWRVTTLLDEEVRALKIILNTRTQKFPKKNVYPIKFGIASGRGYS